jgi:hypothetical protein
MFLDKSDPRRLPGPCYVVIGGSVRRCFPGLNEAAVQLHLFWVVLLLIHPFLKDVRYL